MSNYHVSKDKELNLWGFKREGAERASGYAESQRKAEIEAKRLSGNSGGGEVRIHGLDGLIRDSDTVPPGHDPNPPKDKKY